MRTDAPSQTAMAAAFLRALHPVVDERPLVFEDPLAQSFLPWYQQRFLKRLGALPAGWSRVFRQRRSAIGRMRAQILVRSRYAEDALQAFREGHDSTYVILGAGLDTFAWRQPEPALPVVEIDHPATQRWKREMLARQQRPMPAKLRFHGLDFERESLLEAMRGLNADAPPLPRFISWLGVSYYLGESAIRSTLESLAATSHPGSQLALDYWQQAPTGLDGALLWGTRMATAMQLEPMRTFLTPRQLAKLAAGAGWRVRETFDADAQNRRYLANRRDELAVPGFAHLALLELA